MGRAPAARTLHAPIISALGADLEKHSDVDIRPLEIDLVAPNPPRFRLYVYSLLGTENTRRSTEFKINVRLPGSSEGEYSQFDYSGGRIPVVIGYSTRYDLFALWDPTMRDVIKHAGNMQVKTETIYAAIADGWQLQPRRPRDDGLCEIVICCSPPNLVRAFNYRLQTIGGIRSSECHALPT